METPLMIILNYVYAILYFFGICMTININYEGMLNYFWRGRINQRTS